MNLFVAIFLIVSLPAEAGLRYQKTVLEGALIRAGGPGGTRDLPAALLEDLCEQGIRSVYYLYPETNFDHKGSYSCSHGTLEYKAGHFVGGKAARNILVDIAESLNQKNGSVLVHCWNGWHATGEVAAYALRQFCGWSGDRAAQYWADNIQDKSNLGKYQGIMKRIRNFEPFQDIQISEKTKETVCPAE